MNNECTTKAIQIVEVREDRFPGVDIKQKYVRRVRRFSKAFIVQCFGLVLTEYDNEDEQSSRNWNKLKKK